MVVSQIRGPQYRLPNSIVLIIGTPKKGTPNFGNPPYGAQGGRGIAEALLKTQWLFGEPGSKGKTYDLGFRGLGSRV